jgi:hypothetical protein
LHFFGLHPHKKAAVMASLLKKRKGSDSEEGAHKRRSITKEEEEEEEEEPIQDEEDKAESSEQDESNEDKAKEGGSNSESEEEDQDGVKRECSMCDKNVSGDRKCSSCDRAFCKEHGSDEVYIRDWLKVRARCDYCRKYTCSVCLSTCMDCANDGEDGEVVCDECRDQSPLKEVDCGRGHGWMSCGQHEKDKNQSACGVCVSNKNFNDRYSLS